MAPVPERSIQSGVPLAARTSLRVGGPARWFTVASSSEDVAGAHAWSRAHGVPMVVLGGGTNAVIADAGLEALVVAVQPRGLSVVEDPIAQTPDPMPKDNPAARPQHKFQPLGHGRHE